MSTAFVIEKNVAPPKGLSHRIYPFADMEVGDSFAVPSAIKRASIQNAAYAYGLRSQRKFSFRMTDDGLRVWRIA